VRALITGATGFIGANLVRTLIQKGVRVRALVRPHSNRKNLEGLDVEIAVGDVRDRDSIERAMEGCGLVFHAAALYSFWVRPRRLIYEINVEGTRNVLDVALKAGVERMVYTSSIAALGRRTDGKPADEETPVDPQKLRGDYRRSKYFAEQVALEFARKGLPVVIVNPSFPVGPYDVKPTPSGQVIVDFLNRKMPAYVDTGLNVVDVEDVALGHWLALERGRVGERYILGGENLTMKEFLNMLSEITGLPAPRLKLPLGPLLPVSYVNKALALMLNYTPRLTPETIHLAQEPEFFSPRKAVEELGFPQTPAREALKKAIRWFQENGYVKRG